MLELTRQKYLAQQDGGRTLILPVLISGGPYSEERESRIRSRMAVVSALGVRGYAPVAAEKLGVIRDRWPTPSWTEDPEKFMAHPDARSSLNRGSEINFLRTWPMDDATPSQGSEWIDWPTNGLALAFEWYRLRSFAGPDPTRTNAPKQVLVLWIDERLIADSPGFRLALLLAPLLNMTGEAAEDVAVIGPRSSSTLRSLISELATPPVGENREFARTSGMPAAVSNVLQRISLYLATPNAMDEVLVTNAPARAVQYAPRVPVVAALTNVGFRAVRNFAATDSQLAREILDELALRRHGFDAIDFSNSKHHLVLIHEWDTFYGRMLALTYEAEVLRRQQTNREVTLATCISNLLVHPKASPPHLHTFRYLRGLDGVATGAGSDGRRPASTGGGTGGGRGSLADALLSTEGLNFPEGPQQFDYLQRLAKELRRLQGELRQDGKGSIAAVGIVGSDAYDVLAVLEAVRPELPNAIFFSTELDARYFHPDHWSRSRNLLVASGYGLRLAPAFQENVPPFRDGSQTAQFVAALAALGDGRLQAPRDPKARRFEIGRYGPVDLSLNPTPGTNAAESLHPVPVGLSGFPPSALSAEDQAEPPLWTTTLDLLRQPRTLTLLGMLAFGLTLLLLLWGPFSRLTWKRQDFLAQSLWIEEEDIGGYPGMLQFLQGACAAGETTAGRALFKAYKDEFPELATWSKLPSPAGAAPPTNTNDEAARALRLREQEERTRALRTFLDFLNHHLRAGRLLSHSPAPTDTPRSLWARLGRRLDREVIGPTVEAVRRRRLELNRILSDHLPASESATAGGTGGAEGSASGMLGRGTAAASARAAAMDLFEDLRRRAWGAWLVGGLTTVLGVGIIALLWRQTYCDPRGEGVSFVDGTSAWPTQILRLLALGLAIGFLIDARQRLRGLLRVLTRRFRLSPLAELPWNVFSVEHIKHPTAFLLRLRERKDPAVMVVWKHLAKATQQHLDAWQPGTEIPNSLLKAVAQDVGAIVRGRLLAQDEAFPRDTIPAALRRRLRSSLDREQLARVNRLLLKAAFPGQIGQWNRLRDRWPRPKEGGDPEIRTNRLWHDYFRVGYRRMTLTTIMVALYTGFGFCLFQLGTPPTPPTRGDFAAFLDRVALWTSVFGFLFLTFWTMNAVRACREFIENLSERPARHPDAAREHFRSLRGGVDERFLDEWIDVQLIADLTEGVGRLVWYPSLVFFVLLISRHNWWDNWSWPPALLLIFVLNLSFALASVLILQRAALRAKANSEATLEAKIRAHESALTSSPSRNDATQARALLDEIRGLRRGAFVPFWESPVLGALLVPSSGTVFIELLLRGIAR